MAYRIARAALVLILVWLTALGLNTSNQGVNQLSGQTRGPVIYVSWHNQVLHWDWLGQGHDYPLARVKRDMKGLGDRLCKYLQGLEERFLN